MKLPNDQALGWKKINKIILLVNRVHVNYSDSYSIDLNCNFENISRGRCNLKILKKSKKNIDILFIHTDQPLMDVNVFYSSDKIDKLIKILNMNKSNKNKIKATLEISDNLMVNSDGYLYLKDKYELSIKSVVWSIPII
tara:strand:+ start:538 stop:954 length:417 start_codon:yes stop_codon:yes gene_type:complete